MAKAASGVRLRAYVRDELVRLRTLREQITAAISALTIRPMRIGARDAVDDILDGKSPAQANGNAANGKRKSPTGAIRRDPQALEHTLHFVAERGDKGVTTAMVARTFRISSKAASGRLAKLAATGLVQRGNRPGFYIGAPRRLGDPRSGGQP